MKTRAARLVIAVAMVAAMLIPSSPAMAKGGDAPPPQQVTISSGSGETTRSLDQAGVEVFAVHDGHDLDQYLFRSSSPLDFVIEVDRTYGPVDPDGHPAPGNALFGRHARLTLRAWDVDESYPGTDVEPEVDRIRVNGVQIDGQLSGADGQWSISTFRVPGSLLTLPTGTDPQGRNDFEVLIDTANVGANVWAVEIDWAELRPITDSGPRPVALLHGIQSGREEGDPSRNDMSPFRDYLEDNYPFLQGRVINPFLDTADSVEGRSALLQEPLEQLLTSTGAPNVNLAAHSHGGLVARRYAWDHRGEVNSVVMIAAPNGGRDWTDILCFLNGSNEDDWWCQLRPDYVQNTFNKVVLDHDEITYVALASLKPGSATDDGVVTLESAEWLSQTNPDHPGKHETRPRYSLEHGLLIDAGSSVFQDVLCEPSFYPDADPCPILTAATAPTSSQPAASRVAINHAELVTLPAQGSVDVPLAFEGTFGARILVLFDAGTTGIGGSFGATPLAPSEFFADDALAVSLTDPVDGALTLTNSGALAVTATVLVEIETQRMLTTSVTPSLAAPGQPVVLSATLDGVQPGDTVEATVTDGQGNLVQRVPLTGLGGGQYSAQIEGLPTGSYSVDASTSAPKRWATSVLRVASGGVQFAGGFTEELTGTADGLADALVIRPAISVTTPGRYAVSARLVDSSGATVAAAGTDVDLAAGTQTPALSFDGQAIFASGQSGPYRLVDAVIAISDPLALEAEAADLGPTAAYAFTEFAHFPVRFDLTGFEDTAVDTNGDGVFDELRVTGSMDVDASGTYAINAQLRSADNTQVAEFQTTASVVTGSNSFVLTFDGEQIALAGLDGPFTVEDLSVYSLSDPNAVGYLVTAHTTAAYTAAQFGGSAAWPPSVRLNNDTGAQTQQERPAVVIAPDGAVYAIWDDMRNGNQTDVYFSRRDPATGTWGPNQKVNNDATTRAQWRAAIAVDGSNNAYAVWQDEREGNRSADANIYFAKRPAASGTWGANLRVNNDTKGAVQTSPRIAVTSAGEAVAVWVDRRSNQWNIYSSRLPAGSSTWGANLRVTDNTSSRKDAPDMAIASDGTVYAVWEDDRSGNWDIYWSKLTPGSSTWTANARLSDDPGTFAQYSAAIGIDGSGNVLAGWLDDRAPNTEVRSRRLPAGSGTWQPSQVASDGAADLPSDLALGVAPSGEALAVWADARGTSWDIWGAEYNPTSQRWSVSRPISDDPGSSHQLRPAAAVRGSLSVAVWFDARESYLGDIRASTR